MGGVAGAGVGVEVGGVCRCGEFADREIGWTKGYLGGYKMVFYWNDNWKTG